jgi:hypothetical protein
MSAARWVVTVVAVMTGTLAYVFDWNETHVFNPRWPPHAKFHNAQTLLLGSLLGLVTLYLVWGRSDLRVAVVVCSLYWVTQLGSLAFPGTSLTDPEFREKLGRRAGMQPALASVLLGVLLWVWVMV